MKTCKYCFEEKEVEEFVRDKNYKDGRENMCYECKRKKNRLRDHKKRNDLYFFGGNKEKVLERDGYRCVVCGISRDEHLKKIGRDLCIDHIDLNGKGVPKSEKNNSMDNLRTMCLGCHSTRHNKEPECEHEWVYAHYPILECKKCSKLVPEVEPEKPAKKECKVDCKVKDKSVVRDKKEFEPNDCGVFYHSKDELADRLEKKADGMPNFHGYCSDGVLWNFLADEARRWAVEVVEKFLRDCNFQHDSFLEDELVARLKESK